MVERGRELNSDVTGLETTDYRTVFVDTSLGTNLVMLLSPRDTASDFKNKLVMKHMQCFPEFDEIKIHSLKVKRRGSFYHLPDLLFVHSAFHGLKGTWFLTADSSCTLMGNLNEKSSDPGSNKHLETNMSDKIFDVSYRVSSSDVNRTPAPPVMSSLDGATEKNVVSEITDGFKVETSSKGDLDYQCNGSSVDDSSGTVFHGEKKRKTSYKEDVCHNPVLEDIVNKDSSRPEITDSLMVDAAEAPESVFGCSHQENLKEVTAEVAGVKNDQPIVKNGVAIEGETEKREKDAMLDILLPHNSITGMCLNELADNVLTDHSEGVSVKELNLSAGLIDNTGEPRSAKSDGKTKRKKAKKSATKIHVSSYVELENRKGENADGAFVAAAAETSNLGSIVCSPALVTSDRGKEDVLKNVIHENVLAGKSDTEISQHDQAYHSEFLATKELNLSAITSSGTMQDANADGKKKRKKAKKAAAGIADMSDMAHEAAKGDIIEETLGLATRENCNRNSEMELGKNVPAENSDVIIRDSNLLVRVVDTNGTVQDVESGGKRKKSKKDTKMPDASHLEHNTGRGVSYEPFTETCNIEEKEKESLLSLNHDEEVMLSLQSKTSNCVDPDLSQKSTSSLPNLFEENIVMEHKISESSGRRKKKRGKKSGDNILEISASGQTSNGLNASSGLLCSSVYIPEETGRAESILYSKSEELQVKPSHVSAADNKVSSANENEANLVISQNEQTAEDVETEKKKMGIDNQSLGTFNVDVPVSVKDNDILESSQVGENKESTGNTDKKSKRKKKKSELTVSDVQKNLSINDQKISAEVLGTKDNFKTFPNSEQQDAHIASSQANPTKSVPNQLIDFKQHFVRGPNQHKAASAPSMEIQRSLKSSDNQESGIKSGPKIAGDKRHGDSSLNSDENEVIQKHNEILAASSFTGRKNRSSARSSSERSDTFPGNRKDKRRKQVLDVNTKMAMKTPQEKSLSTKTGAIFQENSGKKSVTKKSVLMKTPQQRSLLAKSSPIFHENSGEDSGDDNGAVLPNAGTHAPSDSSSQSGNSEDESDLSHNSNGQGRSGGEKSLSMLGLSASQDISINTILRSTKLFKKAKLVASQIELEQNEFLPDSQPNP